ncbi:MAG: Rieske 2Fe-2S domain-containing protein, partial [Myxococcaceae bacterium]|nr:Rieske 2Fe-2S domain-containing protein [Myxococcaceae bacterium]
MNRVATLVSEELDRAHALPARFYRGEEVLAFEHEHVFGRSWQLVAHAGELTEVGDHVVTEVGRMPVLIVRGEDGGLRAFPNVCR